MSKPTHTKKNEYIYFFSLSHLIPTSVNFTVNSRCWTLSRTLTCNSVQREKSISESVNYHWKKIREYHSNTKSDELSLWICQFYDRVDDIITGQWHDWYEDITRLTTSLVLNWTDRTDWFVLVLKYYPVVVIPKGGR